jgi:hypothetical protein
MRGFMAEKSYRVFFYTTAIGSDGATLSDGLDQLKGSITSNGHLTHQPLDDHIFQLRDLAYDKSKGGWKGVFGRLRSDAPNVITADDMENALPLSPTDLLIEKSHFLYKPKENLLIWQSNIDVGSVNRFALYLSNALNDQVWLNLIVDVPDLQRVMNGTVKYYEIKVATPKTPLQKTPSYSQAMFDLMNGVGGSTIKCRVSAGRDTLDEKVKRTIKDLMNEPTTESLKVGLEGDLDPVDLFTDKISAKITVTLNGHYPNPADIYNLLDYAFHQNKDQLSKFI